MRRERSSQSGLGGEVERGAGVVEQIDERLRDERPSDRESFTLAARQVAATLGDRALEPSGSACTKLDAWATSSASQS